MNKKDKYIKAYKECERFMEACKQAVGRLGIYEYAKYGCKETAAAKRASMDLSRALSELRKPD